MTIRNSPEKYGSIAKLLHWVIALLVVLMLFLGYFMSDIKDKTLFAKVVNIHKLTGITILILMVLRVLWTWANPKPVPLSTSAIWERFLERTVHILFYIVLIAMPLSGWIMAMAEGHPPKLFGWLIKLPVPKNETTGNVSMDIHSSLAIVIIVLVSIHILAALYHYVFKKDKILQLMLPEVK